MLAGNQIADMVLSSSEKATLVHSLRTGQFLRNLDVPGTVSAASISNHGTIVLLTESTLISYSPNAEQICTIDLDEEDDHVHPTQLEIIEQQNVVAYISEKGLEKRIIFRDIFTMKCTWRSDNLGLAGSVVAWTISSSRLAVADATELIVVSWP